MSREALSGDGVLINRSAVPLSPGGDGRGFRVRDFPSSERGLPASSRAMPPAALLRYEFALFARSFADAFSRTRDRLLLAIALGLALLWLRQAMAAPGGFSLPVGSALLALAAAPVAFQWSRVANRRLDWLAEESALAPRAADCGARWRYRLAAQLLVLIPSLLAAALLGLAAGRTFLATGLAAGAYGAGALASGVRFRSSRSDIAVRGRAGPGRRPLSGRRTALLALLRVQVLRAARPGLAAGLLLAANAILTFAATVLASEWALARESAPAVRAAASALPSLLLVAATARNDARLGGFLAFAGYSSGFVALAVSAFPLASFAAAAAGAYAGGSPGSSPAIVTLACLHLGAALVAIARIWLSPGREGRRVDLQVQLEAVGLVMVGLILPPLGIVAVVARLWRLRGAYRESIWLQP
jgi:hypothetical protein